MVYRGEFDARIVDEEIDRTEVFESNVDHPGSFRGDAQVCNKNFRASRMSLNCRLKFGESDPRVRDEQEVHPFRCQRIGQVGSQSAIGAGQDCCGSGQGSHLDGRIPARSCSAEVQRVTRAGIPRHCCTRCRDLASRFGEPKGLTYPFLWPPCGYAAAADEVPGRALLPQYWASDRKS